VFDNAFNPAKALDTLLSNPVKVAFAIGEYAPWKPVGGDPASTLNVFFGFFAADGLVLIWVPSADADLGGFFKFPDFNRLHLNWHALGVLLVKLLAISFQPNFC
jgi:hypothetical protein